MSFRAWLATFFVLIVVVPMAAVGFLVFSLIDESRTGKTDGVPAMSRAIVRATASRPRGSIAVSELTAAAYAHALTGRGIDVVLRSGPVTLASTLPPAAGVTLSAPHGTVTLGRDRYRVLTEQLSGFHNAAVAVSVLSNINVTDGSLNADRLLEAGLIAAFLILAFFFALLATRALQGQLVRFLDAARRRGSGDFSSPIQTSGRDEFAALGEEFNSVSRRLERPLEELGEERSRVLSGIRRIGEAFASGLDRDTLLELSLKTAIDATGADRGRVSVRVTTGEPLTETTRVGRLAGLEEPIFAAERPGGRWDRGGLRWRFAHRHRRAR